MNISFTSRRFEADMYKFAEKTERSVEFVIKSAAFQLFREVVKGTPVDTGHARANWNIAVNTVDRTVSEKVQETKSKLSALGVATKASNASLASAIAMKKLDTVSGFKLGNVIIIANSVSYIRYLEEGTPHMRPFKMVANAMESVALQMRQLLRNAEGRK